MRLFKRKQQKAERTEFVWDMEEHRFWSDRMQWFKYEEGRIVGWMTPKPLVGDEIRSPMKSGRTGRFRVIVLDSMMDPPDMFFATVTAIGWLDEDLYAPPINERRGGLFV